MSGRYVKEFKIEFITTRQVEVTFLYEHRRINWDKEEDPQKFKAAYKKMNDCVMYYKHSKQKQSKYVDEQKTNINNNNNNNNITGQIKPNSYNVNVQIVVTNDDILVAEYTYRAEQVFHRYTYHNGENRNNGGNKHSIQNSREYSRY